MSDMSDEEDSVQEIEAKLISEAYAEKVAELEALQELAAEKQVFGRSSRLTRTPPSGFSTPTAIPPPSPAPIPAPPSVDPTPALAPSDPKKRGLTSPEEVQSAVRRRVVERRPTVTKPPPSKSAAANTSAGSVEPNVGESGVLTGVDKIAMIELVHRAVRGISNVCNATNKLNMQDKAAVSAHSQDILAVVAALELQFADLQHKVIAGELKLANLELELVKRSAAAPASAASTASAQPLAVSYSGALKMPKGKAPIPVQQQGPSVIFYPADDKIKTSEETKKVLQEAVKPSSAGIRVQSVRMVGNSGVVVRTATAEAAERLKAAAPKTLKVTEPKARQPRVALRYLRADLTGDEIVSEIHRINLADDPEWPLDRFQSQCKLALKKQVGPKFLVLLECSMGVRDKLVSLGRVYVGWDEADVTDHVRATCCNKCQQYGHPEKYCRSKETVCGKCGETGHKHTECQATTQCCATCRRFKRKDAHTHVTAAASCPARMHAEQQAVNQIHYG